MNQIFPQHSNHQSDLISSNFVISDHLTEEHQSEEELSSSQDSSSSLSESEKNQSDHSESNSNCAQISLPERLAKNIEARDAGRKSLNSQKPAFMQVYGEYHSDNNTL